MLKYYHNYNSRLAFKVNYIANITCNTDTQLNWFTISTNISLTYLQKCALVYIL